MASFSYNYKSGETERFYATFILPIYPCLILMCSHDLGKTVTGLI